eukprot:scaffold72381_cov77-Phaeocystis_antarctica.AAC.6
MPRKRLRDSSSTSSASSCPSSAARWTTKRSPMATSQLSRPWTNPTPMARYSNSISRCNKPIGESATGSKADHREPPALRSARPPVSSTVPITVLMKTTQISVEKARTSMSRQSFFALRTQTLSSRLSRRPSERPPSNSVASAAPATSVAGVPMFTVQS